jgi:hypothetical protein
MIDTQRLGALLRALIREDVAGARLRTPSAAPVRPLSTLGPELASPAPDGEAPKAARAAQVGAAAARAAQSAAGADETRSVITHLKDRLTGDVATGASGARAAPATGAATRTSVTEPPRPGFATPRSAALELSDTGRILLAALRADPPAGGATPVPGSAMQPVLGSIPGALRGATPGAVNARSPLISVPPHSEVATDRLALQLKDAVEFSGVFYEAHLAQWADDMRPRALLAHEPQSRWPVATEIAQRAAGSPTQPEMPSQAPADYATPLLRQQLEVLDTGRFIWRGELWPGQRGTLVIEEDEAPPQRADVMDVPQAPRWRMRMSLEFPQLGAIDATLLLTGESVDFNLRCDESATAARLRGAAPTLRVAIAERALDVAALTIADMPAGAAATVVARDSIGWPE